MMTWTVFQQEGWVANSAPVRGGALRANLAMHVERILTAMVVFHVDQRESVSRHEPQPDTPSESKTEPNCPGFNADAVSVGSGLGRARCA